MDVDFSLAEQTDCESCGGALLHKKNLLYFAFFLFQSLFYIVTLHFSLEVSFSDLWSKQVLINKFITKSTFRYIVLDLKNKIS